MNRTLERICTWVGRAYRQIKAFFDYTAHCHVAPNAACCAYFLFLSLPPILALACSLLRFTPIDQDTLANYLTALVPQSMHSFFEGIISEVYDSGIGTLSLSILALVWSASRAFVAIAKGLNEIYCGRQRNYIAQRLYASLYTVCLVLATLLSLTVMVFGREIASLLGFSRLTMKLVLPLRFVVLFVLLALLFTSFYCFAPNRRLRFRDQLPGATLASFAWILFSFFFSIFVSYSNFSVYGSLTMIVLTLMWLYYCMTILLIGGCVNSLLEINHITGVKRQKEHSDDTKGNPQDC